MDENSMSGISKASSDEQMGEFWDTHDFTDYDAGGPDVAFRVRCAVPVEADLLALVEQQARMRGVRSAPRR